MRKTLLLDGKFMLYRALTTQFKLTHNETITGSLYGFINSTRKLAKKFEPDNMVILWDSDISWRRRFFPGYKLRNQKQNNEIIVEQLKAIKKEYSKLMLEMKLLGFASHLRIGLEADDLFYWYTRQFKNEKCIIVSKDEDLYQLLEGDRVIMYDPQKEKQKTERWLMKEKGLTPEQWIMYKGINGCTTDTVPGIPGIGEKTTIKYLKGEAKIKEVDTIKSNWINVVERNLRLVKLPFELEKPVILRPKQTHFDSEAFFSFCQKYNFRTFIKEIHSFECLTRIQ